MILGEACVRCLLSPQRIAQRQSSKNIAFDQTASRVTLASGRLHSKQQHPNKPVWHVNPVTLKSSNRHKIQQKKTQKSLIYKTCATIC